MTSRPSLVLLVGLGVTALAGAGAYWVATNPQRVAATQSQAQDPLTVQPAHLDFGEVWEDAAFVWQLPIENRGPADVRVTRFSASCGCLDVEPQALDVPAGESRPVRLKLDLSSQRLRAAEKTDSAPPAVGAPYDFAVDILAGVQGPDGRTLPPVNWTVRGRVRPVLTVEPRTVSFGESLVQGESHASQVVNVTVHAPLERVDLTCEPDLMTAQLVRLPGRDLKYELKVQPKSDLPAGPFKCTVVLRPQTGDGPLPRVALPIQGHVRHVVNVLPRPHDLGRLPVGTRARATFWVGTNRPAPLEAVAVMPDDDRRTRVVQVQKEGDRWRVEVERLIDAPGYGAWQGVIRTTPSYGSRDEPRIDLRWYGTVP